MPLIPGDDWTLVQERFDPSTSKAFEGLFTLGSGRLHVRGSLEEPLADAPQNEEYTRVPANVTSEVFRQPISKWGTYLATPQTYGRHPLLGAQLVNLPWFLWLRPVVDGEPLDSLGCEIVHHERRLDLRRALLSRHLIWRTKSGVAVTLRIERFISAGRPGPYPGVCVQRMTIEADRRCEIAVEAGIDADVRTNGFDHFQKVDFARTGEAAMALDLTLDSGAVVSMASDLRCDAPARFDWRQEARRAAVVAHFDAEAGRRYVFEKRSAAGAAGDSGGIDLLGRTLGESFDDLLAGHAFLWEARWRECDVEIDGHPPDADSQRAIRTSIFHLLRAHPGEGAAMAIDAKGYAGEAYWGRFFWDTEIYLLPFFLHTQPRLALSLLEFRLRTLPAAIENARSQGFAGAKYPWEAGPDGREECPNAIYAEQEVHITADVVYGLAHYFRGAATGDDAFFEREDVQRVLVETARYWMTRITWIDGKPHLHGVMGPDEYTPACNDNAYTNAMVSHALALAVEHAGRNVTQDEWQAWSRASELPILRHPDDPALILQCEEFHRLADLDFEAEWADRSRTLAAQAPLERLYRSKSLKQADVILLMTLLARFSETERRRAWAYYEPLTTHDSSLSRATHALFAARLGLKDEAWRFWRRACEIDLNMERGGAGEGMHIANCGMLWQTVVYGFAGISSARETDILTLEPHLPQQWRRVRFPFTWRGNRFMIDVAHDCIAIRNDGPHESACVVVNGVTRPIHRGNTEAWDSTT